MRKGIKEGLRGRVASPNELGYVLAAGYLDRHRPAARVRLRDGPGQTFEIVKAPTPKAMTETPLEGDAMMILKAKMMAGK